MEQFILNNSWLIIILGLWTLPWTGIALWKSACRKEKWWFIILLVTNTLGLLEILYIFVFSKKKEKKDSSEKDSSVEN